MADAILTAERLRELLHYNPDTGIFTWRIGRRGKARAGSVAGCPTTKGYLTIRVDGVSHQAHRLAWLYVTGSFPANLIDHRDEVKTHNWFSNLRDATHSQNCQNVSQSRARTNRENRLIGTKLHPETGRWMSVIVADKRQHHLGTFATQEQAHEAYMLAKRKLHPGFVQTCAKKADLVSDWEKFI